MCESVCKSVCESEANAITSLTFELWEELADVGGWDTNISTLRMALACLLWMSAGVITERGLGVRRERGRIW